MKTRLILGIVVVIFAIVLGVLFVNMVSNNIHFPFSQPKSTAVIDGHTFHVKVATTQQDQEQGLSDTPSLPTDQGMLFVFQKPDFYGFWMRNMNYPLDIIYIQNNKIVSIAQNVSKPKDPTSPLPVYKPSDPADKVLEINGGLTNTYHISIHDTVSISL
jgi:uncharacterized membrane protein (UPF0127 family)